MSVDQHLTTDPSKEDIAATENSPSTGQKLRFGVMSNGGPLSVWQAQCIRELTQSGVAVPVMVIANGASLARKPLRQIGDVNWKNLIFEMYIQVFGSCSATRRTDERPLFTGLPAMRCTVERQGKYSEIFSDHDLEEIAGYKLDFILRFGFGIIRGKIHDVPRYGVWSFHHDDERAIRGTPSAFWPIYNGAPESGVILQRLTDRLDGGVVLRRKLLPTIDTSYIGNREQMFLAGVTFPTEICRDILAGNTHDVCADPSRTDAPVYYRPTNLQMIRFIGILARNRLRRWIRGTVPGSSERDQKQY